MKSSMSTGERRWASSGRRGGMTVIGKVVVPKPINLPSQRLENQGQDPNAEVVPKGAHSWGGKSSSTASNPWGSSTPSPNTDGGGGSPSYLSGRPSSGGSGTRPSTASSDRGYEPANNNAWGQNSRPSSASGLVTSNQTSLTYLRPHSAETRPGSSHLSRFAESVTENSGAWGATGTAEKLGVKSSRKDGFSLASGDFPTLGAEKDNSEKNIESQDHGDDRPDSSSSGVAPARERNATVIDGESSVSANVKRDHAESWKRDNPAYREDVMRPSVEKGHGDPQPYHNANIHPHHYEAWRGPPVNNSPGGVWYRGPPGAPPYGNPVPPGGFPMEPFPYFHPHMPGAALANPQPVPPPGAGPRGPHPNNGDMYRPHMPDAYIRPGMPIRPGFYPGPVPFDSYYAPPMGYCNPNERDIPFMGMGAGPGIYNRGSVKNGPDPRNYHARSGGYGSTGKALVPEHDDSGHPRDQRGPYKVLLKQHGGLDRNNDQKWEGNASSTVTCNEKGEQQRTLEDSECGADHKNEGTSARKTVGEPSYQTSDNRGSHSSARTKVNPHENMANRKSVDDISVKKLEPAAYPFPESQGPLLPAPKESSLIQKIEGLNAKARDARHDVSSVHTMDGHRNEIQVVKANLATNEADSGSVHHERSHSRRIFTHPHGVVSTGDRNLESTNDNRAAISRRSHGMQGRSDHRDKGRINAREGDDWQKRSPVVDYPNRVSAVPAGASSIISVQGHHAAMLASDEKSGPHPQMKDERQIGGPIFDLNDPQRVKMKEVAQQRHKQRQKEEEERISRQKANARAKLEELNRRSQAVDGSGHKNGPVQDSKEGSQLAESVTVTRESEGSSSTAHPNLGSEIGKSNNDRDESSTISSSEPVLIAPDFAPTQVQNVSVPAQSDAHSADACKNTSEISSMSVFKQKHTGFRQNQRVLPEKSAAEKVSSKSVPEALKGQDNVPVGPIRSDEVADNGSVPHFERSLPESSHQKRKNKSSRNKHKLEAVSSTASLPSSMLKETNSTNISVENDKPKPQEPELLPSSLQSVMALKDADQSLDRHSSLLNEESHVKVNNLSRSQNSRRVQRNPQINRVAEKLHTGDAVVWAPIRSHNRAEVFDEASDKTVVEAVASTVKRDSVQNINAKNKRAEMEIYVPKPVAKELAQVTVQQTVVPSFGQATSDEAVESADLGSQGTVGGHPPNSSTGKVGTTVEYRNADSRQNKQGKVHGSWRQRGASESTSVQGLQDGLPHTSNSNRNVEKSVEHQKPKKLEAESSEKEQPEFSGEGNVSNVLNISGNSDSVPVLRDQRVAGRGKRQPLRGLKSMGNSRDNEQNKINSLATEISAQSLAPQISPTDSAAPLDDRGGGERSTHWQPKSQAFPRSSDRALQPDGGGQNFNVEVARGKKKEPISQSGMLPPSQHTETGDAMTQPHPTDHHVPLRSRVEEAPRAVHQEAKREKTMASLKGHPHLPNQALVGSSEPPSGSTDNQHEHQHRSFSGFRKNGNQNSRFGIGQDSHGHWSSGGQDNRQHNQPANRERQRQNSHYEYQRVGPYNNSSTSGNAEGPDGGSHNMGARFRERGQGNLRRGGGNFHGRQTDRVRVDADHE